MPADLSPFAEACALRQPIDLRVSHANGMVMAEGELDIPCAVVGRDPACEVTLTDPDVSPRHACIQALGGRVLIADTGSQTGLIVGGQRRPAAWLTPNDPVSIGPFRLVLRKPLFVKPTLPDANPFSPHPAVAALPRVAVRLMNGKSANAQWIVNRAMTFVGRAPDCKVRLSADDIADHHCTFLLTPAGLWVVDLLSPSGVCVNAEPVRFSRLQDNDRLTIGRFEIGIRYLAAEAPPAPPPPPAPRPYTAFVDAQSQMIEQFQLTVTQLVRTFGDLQREQAAAIRAELARFTELNQQLQRLATDPTAEAEVTRLNQERQTLWDRLTTLSRSGSSG